MATNQTVGNMIVNLLFDDRGLSTGAKKAKAKIAAFATQVRGAASAMDQHLTRAALAATAAVAGLGVAATLTGKKFEKTISEVAAVSGAEGSKLGELAEEARRIGATTNFTATQAAEAMIELARSGQSVEEILVTTNSVMALAGANNFDLARSAMITAAAMKQFGLESKEATRVADVFTRATQKSLLDMSALNEAMKFAGSTGKALGLTLEQTTAAVAQFRDLGLEGSLAGTNFRMAMLGLVNVSDKGKVALSRMGLTLADINPQLVGFSGAMQALGDAGLTAADAMNIVGMRAGANVAQISASFAEGRTNFHELHTELIRAGGTAQNTYAKMMDNVQGRLDIFKSAAQEALLVVFDQMRDPLFEFFDRMGEKVQLLALGFTSLGDDAVEGALSVLLDGIENIFDTIVGLVPHLKILAKWMFGAFVVVKGVILASHLVTLASGIKALGVAALGLFGPAGPIVMGVVAVGALVTTLFGLNKQLKEANRQSARLEGAQRGVNQAREFEKKQIEAMVEATNKKREAALEDLIATEGLTEAELKRRREWTSMTGEMARRQVVAGRLLDIEGNLILTEEAIAMAGKEAIPIIENHTNSLRKRLKVDEERLRKLKDISAEIDDVGLVVNIDEIGFDVASRAAGLTISSIEDLQAAISDLQTRNKTLATTIRNIENETAKQVSTQEKLAQTQGLRDQAEDARELQRQLRALAEAGGAAGEETKESFRDVAKIMDATLPPTFALIDNYRKMEAGVKTVTDSIDGRLRTALLRGSLALNRVNEEAQVFVQSESPFRRATRRMADALKSIAPRILAEVRFAMENLARNASRNLKDRMLNALDAVGRAFRNLGRDISQGLLQAFQKAMGPILNIIDSIFGAVEDITDTARQIEDLQAEADRQRALGNLDRASSLEQEARDIQDDPSRGPGAFIRELADNAILFITALAENLPVLIDTLIEETPRIVDAFIENLPKVITAIVDGLPRITNSAVEQIPKIMDALIEELPRLIKAISDQGPVILQALVDELPALISALLAEVPTILESFGDAVVILLEALPEIVEAILEMLPGIITALVKQIPKILTALVKIIPELISVIIKAVPEILFSIIEVVPELVKAIIDVIPNLMGAMLELMPELIEGFIAGLPDMLFALLDMVGLVFEAFISLFPQMWQAVISGLPGLITAFVEAIPGLWSAVISFIPEFFKLFFTEMIPALIMAIPDMLKAMGELFVEMAKAIAKGVGNAVNVFKGKDKDGDGRKGLKELFDGDRNVPGGLERAQSGIDFVPRTMATILEPGEGILDAAANAARLAAGTNRFEAPASGLGNPGGTTARELLEILVMMDSSVVDAQLVRAMDEGRAPNVRQAIRRTSNTRVGMRRRKLNPWGS